MTKRGQVGVPLTPINPNLLWDLLREGSRKNEPSCKFLWLNRHNKKRTDDSSARFAMLFECLLLDREGKHVLHFAIEAVRYQRVVATGKPARVQTVGKRAGIIGGRHG